MKLIFTLVLLAISFSASAQKNFEIKTERQEDKSVRLWAEKDYAGKITVVLTFKNLENAYYNDDGLYVVGTSATNLVRLRPLNDDEHISYSYSYRYFYGDIDAEADTTFVYRLPISTLKSAQVRTTVDMYDHYLKKKDRTLASVSFDVAPTDTIYAARKGVVVRMGKNAPKQSKSLVATSEYAYVEIEHADGSCATYSMLNPDSILVEVGQTVYPDTPIAFPWSYEGERYLFFFHVFDPTWVERGLKSENQQFMPLFKTELGVAQLRNGVEYRAVVDDELVECEMTSREKKRRRRQ